MVTPTLVKDAIHIQPRNENVLIRIPKAGSTEGGLLLPDGVKHTSAVVAKVVAVGPGRILDNGERAKIDLKVGDKVLTSYTVGWIVSDRDPDLRMCQEHLLLGVVKGE